MGIIDLLFRKEKVFCFKKALYVWEILMLSPSFDLSSLPNLTDVLTWPHVLDNWKNVNENTRRKCNLPYQIVFSHVIMKLVSAHLYVSKRSLKVEKVLNKCTFKRQPNKMVKHCLSLEKLTIEFLWPFCGLGV